MGSKEASQVEPEAVYQKAIRQLARHEMSVEQMRGSLLAQGVEAASVAGVLERLQQEGALDDRRFAFELARKRILQSGRALAMVRDELLAAGVAKAQIDLIWEQLADEIDPLVVGRQILASHFGTHPARDEKEKRRMANYLLRRGYEWDEVQKILDTWGEQAFDA